MKAFEVRILDPIKQERNYFNLSKLYPFICSEPFDLISCRSNYCFLCVVLRCSGCSCRQNLTRLLLAILMFHCTASCSLHSLCPCSSFLWSSSLPPAASVLNFASHQVLSYIFSIHWAFLLTWNVFPLWALIALLLLGCSCIAWKRKPAFMSVGSFIASW